MCAIAARARKIAALKAERRQPTTMPTGCSPATRTISGHRQPDHFDPATGKMIKK
jgi:hypothetical protein